MSNPLKIDVITLFPNMLDNIFGESMMKRAADMGRVEFRVTNPRDFALGLHRKVDDRPYGGGPGMVMMCDPLFQAVESVMQENSKVILMTPQGRSHKQSLARELSSETHLIFICGHYEGIDERVHEALVDMEISIGDYVLTNGVLGAAVVIDSIVRLLPGVLGGGVEAIESESFSEGLLEFPQYTRPAEYRGMVVPEILSSGDHGKIAKWRHQQSLNRTQERRPDLLKNNE